MYTHSILGHQLIAGKAEKFWNGVDCSFLKHSSTNLENLLVASATICPGLPFFFFLFSFFEQRDELQGALLRMSADHVADSIRQLYPTWHFYGKQA